MIPARKQRFFNAWFASHARSRIRRTFGALMARGLEETRALAAEGPLLFVANHSSWWDPLVVLHLSQHLLDLDAYAMMDAKNLRRLPFFALVGAFGVDLDRPADGTAGIRYAARLLDREGRGVWVFPQGRERPSDARPLGFLPGAALIARVARRALVVPVALRYEFAGEERPHLYVAFGPPLAATRDPEIGRAAQEQAVTAELDRIRQALATGSSEFAPVHRARGSLVGAAAEKLLAHWTRPRGPLTPGLPEGSRAGPR